MSLPELTTPTVLGVDDWAYRKRSTYGSILVDLETHQPVDLLSDHSQDLKAVEEAFNQTPVANEDGSEAVRVLPPPSPDAALRLAQQRRARRLAAYEQVWRLRQQGWSGTAIAQSLGISKTTVFRYLGTAQFPERKGRSDRGRSLLDPYKDYVLQRWNSGCHEGKRLFYELLEQGYDGSYATVARYARRLRQAQGLEPRQSVKGRSPPKVIESNKLPLTVSRATWLVLRRPENRDEEDEPLLERLIAQNPKLAEAIELSQDLADLVRNREPKQLDIWLMRAVQSPSGPLVRFATRLVEDYEAVKAGVTLDWSNGQVEGQINRLKMLKRQMYGRAKLDLLSQRFLLAV